MTEEPEVLPKNSHSRWPAILIGIAIFGLVAGGGYYLGVRKKTASPSTSSSTTTSPSTSTTPSSLDTASNAQSDGVTWYSELKAVTSKPTLFTDLTDHEYGDYSVQTAGEFEGKKVLIVGLAPQFPDSRQFVPMIVLDGGDGSYKLILKNSPNFQDVEDKTKYLGPTMASTFTLDTSTSFASIDYQTTLTVNGVELAQPFNSPMLFGELSASSDHHLTKYADTAYGTLYKDRITSGKVPDANNLALERFVLKQPDQLAGIFQFYPKVLDDSYGMKVTWSDGTSTTSTYRLDGTTGCGSPDSVTVWESDLSALTATGKTSGGEAIYTFASTADPIVKYYYGTTGGKRFEGENEVSFTIEDYLKAHGVIAYKDVLGRILIFTNNDYGSGAECGKPMVYLYPTQPTDVSVQVGADVTKSEPMYGNGWFVHALPSGQLTTSDGHRYDSLFWEGLGHGTYPTIDQGFVVAKADLEATLHDHLARLGLNDRETSDFLEFWLPRMPQTPYTRLTWLGTRQMNELAPLIVSPKPDTSIRIFLDFAGLNHPIDIAPQHLGHVARRGFTLVEWGGLLR